MNEKQKTTIGAIGGTLTEYYDYSLYGFSSAYIAKEFFPATDEATSLMITFGVFAVGYISKPLGALIFGYLGDKFGRKFCLNVTVIGIAIPTMLIGLCPSHAKIGVWAAFIVTACRFLQGIFVGGEYDGAAIYLLEHKGKANSGYASALMRSASVGGLLLGAIVLHAFTYFSEEYWRIPFLCSLVLMLFTLYFRPSMAETPEFLEYWQKKKLEKNSSSSLKILLKNNWGKMASAALLFGCSSGCVQFLIFYMKAFLPTLSAPAKQYSEIVHFSSIVCLGISMLFTAALSDRLGILRVMRFAFMFSFAAVLVLIYGMVSENFPMLVIGYLTLCFTIGPVSGLMHGIVCRIFAVHERYRAVSISHNLGSMMLSGSTPFFASMILKITGVSCSPFLYLFLLFFCSFCLSKVILAKVEGSWGKPTLSFAKPSVDHIPYLPQKLGGQIRP